ncbi:class I SAM-dependent methyltransferase [Paenibacillus sp. GYB003]|uniref:class I SAM-dependent methyltransferase n=1 Tax=Paenibacillus sp. GYB003 TaxID=2994392 RepID=UPI002F9692BB
MDTSEERRFLLESVKSWFQRDEQVRHYANECGEGPTAAERYLLDALPAGVSVLDAGCGAGRISVVLAEKGYRVTGIDVSEPLLDAARAWSEKRKQDVRFVRADGLALPFRDEQFDIVVAFKLLSYIPTERLRNEYLAELHRVLKRGGTCIMTQHTVPDEWIDDAEDEHFFGSPASQFGIVEKGDTFPSGVGYAHWFTARALADELGRTAFEIELFADDSDHGGAGLIRLIKLKKR